MNPPDPSEIDHSDAPEDDSRPDFDASYPSPEHPDHPVRQLIRRVRASQPDALGSNQALNDPFALDDSTWDREINTPGSTEYSRLQNFASSLENYSQLVDAEEVQADLPNQIGRFQIQRILGAGGFGWVLLADDPQLNRPVALKVPRLDTLVSQTGRSRFLREARAAALLSHPNLVSVYEAGQIGPVLYIAFEWVDGQSLNQWLTEHRTTLNSTSIARMMIALAHAVHHAHQRGIVHRDLKPSNILIKTPDSVNDRSELAERAKIADFGLAFLAEAEGDLTRSGALMGTPKYLAPEQIRSSGAQADPTIDVYGLGAVLYELLTGQPPFSGPTLAAIVRAVELDPPVAPRKLNPAVPKDLEAICLKCLEKSPDQRYRSAAALAEELERFVAGIPVQARSPNFLERARRWVQRNRMVTLAFCIAISSLAIGLIVALTQIQRANFNLAESQQQRQRAERHRDRSEIVVDSLLTEFADSLEPIPQMQPLRKRLMQVALEHERATLADEGDDPESKLRVAESLGRIADLLYRIGDFGQSVATCEEIQLLAGQLPSTNADHQLRSSLVKAKSSLLKTRVLLQQQAAAEAEEELQLVLAETATSQNQDMLRQRATALSLLGLAQRDRGDVTAAEVTSLESIATIQSIPQAERTAGDERDIVSAMSMIGSLRYRTGNFDEAVEIWKQVVAREAALDPNEPQQNILRGNRAGGLTNLAMAYSSKRDFNTALEYYRQSNDLYRELCLQFPLHFNHAQGRLVALTGRAASLQNAGQIEAAIESFQEATAWGEQLMDRFGVQSRLLTETGRAWGNLGNLFQYNGQEQEALTAWKRSLAHIRSNLKLQPDNSSNRSDLVFALSNLAAFHLQKNQLTEAELHIDQALPEALGALEQFPGDQETIQSFRNLRANRALLFCFQQDHQEGLAECARIVELQPDKPDSLIFAAKTAARCQLSVAGNLHELFGSEDDEAYAASYADLALELLNKARELGFADFPSLRRHPEFSLIMTDPRFSELEND